MLRSGALRLYSVFRTGVQLHKPSLYVISTRLSHGLVESDDQFDTRYEAYLNRKDIVGWEVRKAMNDICGMDVIPEPRIIIATMKACRRINDYAVAVRFLEALKSKCGSRVQEIYPYIIKEIKPTLIELGIDTPEELGFDEPELYCRKRQ